LGAPVVNSAAHTVTLPITEGPSAADTAVGDMTVNFNPAGSCGLLGFSNLSPLDDARPVVVSVVSGAQPTGGTAGKMEPGDSLIVTFSEALDPATVPANVTVTETRNGNNTNDFIKIQGATLNLTPASQDLGSRNYLTGASSGAFASYPGNVTLDSDTAPTVVTVTIPPTVIQAGVPVPTPCTGTACVFRTAGLGSFLFNPAVTLQSLAKAPEATSTATTPTVVSNSPPPGANFRMF
jgi:hypothetical protein